jgi:hypothetical protein
LSTQAEERPAPGAGDTLVPIAEAARRLRRSVWTLKRIYAKGHLPVTFIETHWFIPESFISQIFASMRPGRGANFAEVAAAWFEAHAQQEAVA